MDKANLRVLIKEPRGFIKILQALFSILAWSMTAGFSTTSLLHIDCPNLDQVTVEYKIKYPFDLREVETSQIPSDCKDDTAAVTEKFPIDFSATSMLFVLVCFLSLVYAIGSAAYYCLYTAKYETDPLAPLVDLSVSIIFCISWTIMSCLWALNVSDLKFYTHPNYFKNSLAICKDTEVNCQTTNPGKWSSLTISVICGFTCIVLWMGSIWFTFKESSLHKKQTYQTGQPQPQPQQQQQQQLNQAPMQQYQQSGM